MANGHGGYRQPSSPAPVSGPGSLSKRTDGGPGAQPVRVPTGGQYGDATQLRQDQQGAPLAQTAGGDQPPPPGLLAGLSLPPGGGFSDRTANPDEPVTSGAATGPGPGPEALRLPNQQDQDMQALTAYLPVFEHIANQPGASSGMRQLVRALKGAA